LPGESALFSRFVLSFHEMPPGFAAMNYHASVSSVDSGFGLVETEVSLFAGASKIASGQCWSYIRLPVPEVEKVDSTGVRPDSLAGRVAVILGSSRGLGAAIERALELRGAIVYGMARSGNAGDLSRSEVGDAADPAALRRLRERICKEYGRLDFLICNACPPVLPLLLEPNSAERIGAYIGQAVSLTLAPLTEFLELLNCSSGCAVIISSVYVEHHVKEFPHYIAAKCAVESLACIASLQYPRVATLIVRPPKLLTAMTNSPMGKSGAASPALFASHIAARLESPLESGKMEILNFTRKNSPNR
jgi:NAD(P)-dependent dehydrogenase (short-subunit alcohol dehydrogenase family)